MIMLFLAGCEPDLCEDLGWRLRWDMHARRRDEVLGVGVVVV